MTTIREGWTLDAVEWDPWLETIDPATASPAQAAVLRENTRDGKVSAYYALLAHDPEALAQRSPLFNAVMYGRGGLPRPDRELASVATSRVNGCVYCASVHGRLFAQLTHAPEIIQRIFDEGVDAELSARNRALVDYAVKLTRAPEQISAADRVPLRAVGLSDLEILDLTHVVAMFAWANRLLETLGEVVYLPGEHSNQ
jgi:uncharacterized peroxidase-related enzyme